MSVRRAREVVAETGQGFGSRRRTPAAIPNPAPASLAATRTASPTGSGARRGAAPAARPARVLDDACDPALGAFARAAVDPAADDREPADFTPRAFAEPPRAPLDEPPARAPDCADRDPPPLRAPPDEPPVRLSLLRPGRERGRFPMTPGSSLTIAKYPRWCSVAPPGSVAANA
jgi:hypothetical protein